MQRGEMREEVHATGPNQPIQGWLAEAIDQLEQDLKISKDLLKAAGVTIQYIDIPSEDTGEKSDDWVLMLRCNKRPVAIFAETRTESNFVLSQMTYYGISQP